MLPSVAVNVLLAVFVAAATLGHAKRAPLKIILRFFTALSNLLCALAALAVAVCRLGGDLPYWAGVLKYVGTAAVTVTMLTVLCFLGPTIGYKKLLTGPDLWLHLVCPVLAIVSLLLWDKPAMPFGAVALGTLPVVLYGAMYVYRVLRAPEPKRWPDFYGFNRGGKWAVSLIAMLAAAFLISVVLWRI
jgi:hypothetical protein